MVGLELTENTNPKQFDKFVETEMDKNIKGLEKELLKIRTGRAHPAMVESIKVMAYGSVMLLKDVAAISAPDTNLLLIQPWDKTVMAEVEKALTNSDLGITPLNDGNVIRIQLPKMSSARRDELTKVLHQKLEACKVAIRNVRKEIHNTIRDTEKSKKISEDLSRRLQDNLQKVTDKFVEMSDKVCVKKEEEIRLS